MLCLMNRPVSSAPARDRDAIIAQYEQMKGAVTDEDPASKVNLFAFVRENLDILAGERAYALHLLGEAAESGFAIAQFDLGSMYNNGEWVKRDEKTALAWYISAAKSEFLPAQIATGNLLYRVATRESDRELVKLYIDNSIYWLRRAGASSGIDDHSRLEVDALLARSLLYKSPMNLDAWRLEKSAACRGSQRAQKLWKIDYDFTAKKASEGDEEAQRLLNALSAKEFSECPVGHASAHDLTEPQSQSGGSEPGQ